MEAQCLHASSGLPLCFQYVQQHDLQTNRQYLEVVLVFLIAAIAIAHPEAGPPERRDCYSQLFTPTILFFVSNVIRQSISCTRTCRDFAFPR